MTRCHPSSRFACVTLPPASCLLPTVFCLLLFAFCLLPSAFGQSATATLSGTVVDENGAVVPEVNVTLLNNATSLRRDTVSNESGYFSVLPLPPGTYRLTATRDGFKTVEVRDIVLNVGDVLAIRIQMKVGNITETVNITSEAALINESPAVGTVVDRQFASNIPLNGRSFQTLIALTPGTVVTRADAGNPGQFSVNGQRANANYFTIDGVSANIGVSASGALFQDSGGGIPGLSAAGGFNNLVSVDAMQEFRVQTSTYAPEFGRTPGAQISIVTRSGTNAFHGALFEYFRNDALDANDWFANRAGLPQPPLRQNQFGGAMGGPILKNRTFFFFSYEGLRLRLPQTMIGTLVPSLEARPAAPPEIQPLLNAYPVPNGKVFPDGSAEFSTTYSDPSSLNATSIRIDQAVSGKLQVFGRYANSPSRTEQRTGSLSSLSETGFKTQTLTLGATWVITPRLTNDLRANYSRNQGENFFETDSFGGAAPPPDSALFPASRSRQDSLFDLGFFSGSPTSLLIGRVAENLQRQFNVVNSTSLVTGAHHLKFGVDYRRLSPINNRGSQYSLSTQFTDLSTSPGGALSGIISVATVTAAEEVPIVFHNFSTYAQDTWQVAPRLTLTHGLRWEVSAAPKGTDKPLFTLDNLDDPTMLRVAPEGAPLYETTYNNIAPRVGLAYQVGRRQGWETALRGGFGIFYDLGVGWLASATVFPYSRSNFLFDAPFPLTPADAAPPAISFDPPFSTFVADRGLKLPYTYQWNAALEQSLWANQTASATYVGAVGRRLLRQERLLGRLAAGLSVTRNAATSDYHALQVQFQRRLSHGLQALASYTWSHSIDISSSDTAGTIPAGVTNVNLDRGSSDFDIRHSFNAALTYDIPTLNAGRVGNVLLENWSVSSIIFARTATPVDLIGDFGFAGFIAQLRPDVVPGVPLVIKDSGAPGGKRFNPAAFAPPPPDRHGTLGRNALRGFGSWQADLGLSRRFNITERVKLQLRAEFFNVFNHPNFGDPGGFQGNFLSSPFFGQSTQMLGRSLGSGGVNGGLNPLYQVGGPRSIQLALKLQF